MNYLITLRLKFPNNISVWLGCKWVSPSSGSCQFHPASIDRLWFHLQHSFFSFDLRIEPEGENGWSNRFLVDHVHERRSSSAIGNRRVTQTEQTIDYRIGIKVGSYARDFSECLALDCYPSDSHRVDWQETGVAATVTVTDGEWFAICFVGRRLWWRVNVGKTLIDVKVNNKSKDLKKIRLYF